MAPDTTADPTVADLLAAAGRESLPDGWTGGSAERAAGQLTRRFATEDDRRVVFYACRETGDGSRTATLARARWDDDRGEYVVGLDLAERADAPTDEALFRAALGLMAAGGQP